MRTVVKFWGSLVLLLVIEAVYTVAFLSYVLWDTYTYYIIGVMIFALWLFYAVSLVVKGPLFAAPGILALCLAILALLIRLELVTWIASIIFLVIAIAYFAVVVSHYRGER